MSKNILILGVIGVLCAVIVAVFVYLRMRSHHPPPSSDGMFSKAGYDFVCYECTKASSNKSSRDDCDKSCKNDPACKYYTYDAGDSLCNIYTDYKGKEARFAMKEKSSLGIKKDKAPENVKNLISAFPGDDKFVIKTEDKTCSKGCFAFDFCPDKCGGNGECDIATSKCKCKDGYFGDRCESKIFTYDNHDIRCEKCGLIANDYKTKEECSSACDKNDNCMYYTFDKAGKKCYQVEKLDGLGLTLRKDSNFVTGGNTEKVKNRYLKSLLMEMDGFRYNKDAGCPEGCLWVDLCGSCSNNGVCDSDRNCTCNKDNYGRMCEIAVDRKEGYTLSLSDSGKEIFKVGDSLACDAKLISESGVLSSYDGKGNCTLYKDFVGNFAYLDKSDGGSFTTVRNSILPSEFKKALSPFPDDSKFNEGRYTISLCSCCKRGVCNPFQNTCECDKNYSGKCCDQSQLYANGYMLLSEDLISPGFSDHVYKGDTRDECFSRNPGQPSLMVYNRDSKDCYVSDPVKEGDPFVLVKNPYSETYVRNLAGMEGINGIELLMAPPVASKFSEPNASDPVKQCQTNKCIKGKVKKCRKFTAGSVDCDE